MRSCTIDKPADTELDLRCLSLSSLLDEEYFATVPAISVCPLPTRSGENEDELYTLFEQAISERVTRISRQLSTLPLVAHPDPVTTDALVMDMPTVSSRWQCFWQARRRAITLACLGLSLLMAGFDLMGLLVITR